MNALKFIVILLIPFVWSSAIAQKTFCDGWENGYDAAMKYNNKRSYIVPICPIPGINQDTYEVGYSKGYAKAIDKLNTTGVQNPKVIKTDTDKSFCDGWEEGYTAALQANNKMVGIIPICPIVTTEDYSFGYMKGYNKGLEKLGINSDEQGVVAIPSDEDATFCDGWEEGYKTGLSEWAANNGERRVPNRITPICPVARINQDTYQHGFTRGRERALEDMK